MKPMLLRMIKKGEIKKERVFKDIIAGIIVAIIALPLSVALGISSGVSPEKGLITAIIAGFFISFLGGSKVQIGGPTGAFVIIVYGIVEKYGIEGLIISTILAGIILVLLGLLKLGSIIKFVPHPITVGFTAGIAITLLSTQIKDFLGLNIQNVPADFIPKIITYIQNISTVNIMTLLIGAISLVIMICWPKINRTIPGSLIAIIVTTLIVSMCNLPVDTIGSRYSEISASIPKPSIPHIDFQIIKNLMQPAFTIAILAAIESLLSAVVADGMIGSKHDSNMELIAQGVGNIASGLLGGIPATGAIARTAANVKNGGKSPLAGIVHAIVLLLIMLLFMPLAKLIPMTTLAAILIIVSYNMGEWKTLYSLLKAPKSDVIILSVTLILTVVFDLVVAIEIGMVLAMFLFMKRISETTNIETREYKQEEQKNVEEDLNKDNVLVYKINGPFFFGMVHKFIDAMKELNTKHDVLVLDMKNATAIDSTAMDALNRLYRRCKDQNIKLLLSNINKQPRKVLKSMGFVKLIGEECIFETKEEALKSF